MRIITIIIMVAGGHYDPLWTCVMGSQLCKFFTRVKILIKSVIINMRLWLCESPERVLSVEKVKDS